MRGYVFRDKTARPISHEGWARDVIDSLPPKTWDVPIWRQDAQGYVTARIDAADVLRLVTAVLDVAMETKLPDAGGRAVPGVYTEEQGR